MSSSDRKRRTAATQSRPDWWRRIGHGMEDGVISAIAAIVAYEPSRLFMFKQGLWSAITAIAIIQGGLRATEKVARDQIIGAAIGGVVGLAALLIGGAHLVSYGLAIVLSMVICAALDVGSASRVAGVTCTILMVVPGTGKPEQVLLARITEVGWGIVVAIATVWLSGFVRRTWRRRLHRQVEQPEGPEDDMPPEVS